MSPNTSRVIGCAAVVFTGAAMALAARAQNPASGRPVQMAAARPTSTSPATRPLPAPAAAPAVTSAPSTRPEVLVNRETYSYPGAGRRDPFVSLMNTEELRPLLGDLKLVAIAFDPSGRNSVAVLRDVSNKEQYLVKVGQVIGRMRVAAIREKNVVFGVEEFGYSRQESLAMTDSSKVRTQ